MAERILTGMVAGRKCQVLMTMGDHNHDDVQEGYWLMMGVERYFDMFYGGVRGGDIGTYPQDMKLKKPRT